MDERRAAPVESLLLERGGRKSDVRCEFSEHPKPQRTSLLLERGGRKSDVRCGFGCSENSPCDHLASRRPATQSGALRGKMYCGLLRGKSVQSNLAYRYAAWIFYQASSNPGGLRQPRSF